MKLCLRFKLRVTLLYVKELVDQKVLAEVKKKK